MVDVRLDLAASALVSGDAVRAEAFTRGVVPQKTEDSYDQEGLAQRLEVLRAALATKRDGDLYDVLAATINSAARPRGGVWTRVVADLARGGGYDAFAAAVLRYAWAPSHELADEALTLLPDVLRDELRATLDQEAAAQASAVAQVAPSGTILKRLSAPRVNAFIERPLPESIAAGERVVIDCEDASRTAASMHIPAGWYPIRLERSGSEVAGVAISRAIDPMGEVGRGGYWVLHSADGGATWDEPLYTGLRENAPYVVVPASRLPLAGDRSLAVEVEVHEIDPASITFPPIGLRAKREARGLYIELSWDALRRDTDRDGLTDLLEDHLGTDIESADTDRDGITDAKDGLPQVALTAGVTPEAQILAKLLTDFYAGGGAIIVGLPGTDEERSACVIRSSAVGAPALFVVGNRDLFSAIDINRRVIVFTPQELEAYTKKFGPTYAADVTLMIVRRDGRKALVVVNESWKENVFELEKTPKGWVMKTVGGWIS